MTYEYLHLQCSSKLIEGTDYYEPVYITDTTLDYWGKRNWDLVSAQMNDRGQIVGAVMKRTL